MNYIIQTPSARKLKEEILKSVESKADGNGNGIVNWQCVETDGADKALVLTEGQWAEKGCITLTQVDVRNELQVRFYYWESWGNKKMVTISICSEDSPGYFWRISTISLIG